MFSTVSQLRKYLAKKRAQGLSLRSMIRTEFHGVVPGTLSRIINDETYDPANQELRDKLHLREICHNCHRPMRVHHEHKPKPELLPAEKWWNQLSSEQKRNYKIECYRMKMSL